MAENHAEDAPLLGGPPPPGPSVTTPSWPQGVQPHEWPPDNPPVGGHSRQGSRDSGCECDDGPQGPPRPKRNKVYSCESLQKGVGPRGLESHSKVTFQIEGDEEEEEDEDEDSARHDVGGYPPLDVTVDSERELKVKQVDSFPRVPSYSKTGVISASSSTASLPVCRFCHNPQEENQEPFISPCRCAGTMQFIHKSCLMKWLEINSRRNKKAPSCELCKYQFHRHKKFRMSRWKLPRCSRKDKLLHYVFLFCLLVMVICAAITIICFKHDRVLPRRDEAELTDSELVTLACGVLFFVSFFVAMYVEVKAEDTLYRLCSRFLYLNQTWHIDEYDKRKDTQLCYEPT